MPSIELLISTIIFFIYQSYVCYLSNTPSHFFGSLCISGSILCFRFSVSLNVVYVMTLYFVSGNYTVWNNFITWIPGIRNLSFVMGCMFGVCWLWAPSWLIFSVGHLAASKEDLLAFSLGWETPLWPGITFFSPGWIYDSWICHCLFLLEVYGFLTSWNTNYSTKIMFYAESNFSASIPQSN